MLLYRGASLYNIGQAGSRQLEMEVRCRFCAECLCTFFPEEITTETWIENIYESVKDSQADTMPAKLESSPQIEVNVLQS